MIKNIFIDEKISYFKEQIILGSILGDGYIYKDKRYEGYGYSERHSLKQKNYLIWKNKYLNFSFKEYKNKKYNICIIRKGDKKFKYYRGLFYPKGIKIVTRNILEKLDPLGLAVWLMDDGNYDYEHNNLRLYTQSFGLKGNKIIQKWFSNRWNIISKIRMTTKIIGNDNIRKKYFYLEVNRDNSRKFIEIIKNHIPKFMDYKIGLDEKRKERGRLTQRLSCRRWQEKNKDKIKAYYKEHKKDKKNL